MRKNCFIELINYTKNVYHIWNIENCIFNNLKKEAGLEHCYNAVEAILYLIFIAGNILQLFKVRRIDLGIDTIVRVKNNKNNSLRHVMNLANKSEPATVWNYKKAFIILNIASRLICIQVVAMLFKGLCLLKYDK